MDLERVNLFKYLGVYLDSCLTFDDHIDWAFKKSSMKLGAIRKIRHNLDRATTLLLYKSLVLPLIDYCDIVYGATAKDKLQKLQLVQNNACRNILLADMDTHVASMHLELQLLTLYQ